MKKSLIALAALTLTGCASLEEAGHAAYTFEASPLGCRATASDGKEFKSRTILVDCSRGQMSVNEGESKAFKGQALAVKAVNVLPTIGLSDILAPRDK